MDREERGRVVASLPGLVGVTRCHESRRPLGLSLKAARMLQQTRLILSRPFGLSLSKAPRIVGPANA